MPHWQPSVISQVRSCDEIAPCSSHVQGSLHSNLLFRLEVCMGLNALNEQQGLWRCLSTSY